MGGTMLRHNYNTTTRLPLSAVYSSVQLKLWCDTWEENEAKRTAAIANVVAMRTWLE